MHERANPAVDPPAPRAAPRARWRMAPPPPPALERAHSSPIVQRVLARSGITDPAAARAFLEFRTGDDDPFRLTGMSTAVERIERAIEGDERIVVFGDYDADGVTGSAVLVQALRALGADAEAHIPHRERDGYGLSVAALDEIASRGARLVVTVDCGVRSVEQIHHAAGIGVDVVVTDHHVPPEELPPALAILNPRLPGDRYGFQDLSGAGMAYKLAQALLSELAGSGGGRRGAARIAADDLLDLVALGTVADVVPLVGENRALVKRGLDVLREARRPGVRALCQAAGVVPHELDARDIGFSLGPRINAAGRMGDARDALDLLLAEDLGRAADLAAILEARNQARRAATDVAVDAAMTWIGPDAGWLVRYASPDVALGVVGLVAGQLTRRYSRPSLVLRVDGEWARGSMRSVPGFDVIEALEAVGDLLERFGGHAQAGGLTVRRDRIDELVDRLERAAEERLAGRDLRPILDIDAEVDIGRVDWALHGMLAALEPCGEGNPQPRLLVRDARVVSSRVVGSDHLKLGLASPSGPLGAIAFGQGQRRPPEGSAVDVVFTLGIDSWRGQTKLSLTVDDFAAPGAAVEPLEVAG